MYIRLFLAAKRGEIVPIIAKEKIIWPPNDPKVALITPEFRELGTYCTGKS